VVCIDQYVGARAWKTVAITGPSRASTIYPVTESLLLPPDVRDYIMSAFLQTTMPEVQTITMLARITHFDIRTFKTCDHVHLRVVELVDPMKSCAIAGWLRGELRPPT
jgi:hypothetical protein